MNQHRQSTPRILTMFLSLTLLLTAACRSTSETTTTSSETEPAAPTTDATTDTASQEDPDAAGGDDAPIVIGHTAGETGFMSVFDLPFRAGLEMAVDEVNADGGILGRQVELITSNHGTDFTQLQASALELVEAGADFMAVSCDFDVGSPGARVANENDIVVFGCAGGPLFGVEGVGPLTYNFYSGSPAEGALLAEFAWDQGYRAPFVLVDETLEYTISIADNFKLRWEELAGEPPVGEDVFQNDDESLASQIGNIIEAEADVILVSSYPPGGPSALRQIRGGGLDQPLLGPVAFDGSYWTEAIPDLTGLYIPAYGSLWGDDPSADRASFFERYAERNGEPPASAFYALAGYSTVEALKVAAEEAQSLETGAVAAALNSFDEELLLVGDTTWTEECHIAKHRELLIIEYADGAGSVFDQRAPESVPESPC